MAKNTDRLRKSRKQMVWSQPRYIRKGERYMTKKGKSLLASGLISEKEAWLKYGKNRYVLNPNAVLIKIIRH